MLVRETLMNDWFFSESFSQGMENSLITSEFVSASLPHNPVDLSLSYCDEKSYQKEFCYKRVLPVKEVTHGGSLKLRFEGVMAYARVWLDGVLLGEHKGGYTAFEFDVTSKLSSSAARLLTVLVDARERPDIPPFGGQIDYLTYAGIYREVSLDEYAPLAITNARLSSPDPLAASPDLHAEVFITNKNAETTKALVSMSVLTKTGSLIRNQDFPVSLIKGEQKVNLKLTQLGKIDLWSPDSPNLYQVKISLSPEVRASNTESNSLTLIDIFETRFGFRSALFTKDGFMLNGKKLKIRGLNRHQAWPYVGYAMPKRAQIKDADILKEELGLNLVRTSHYPQSIHFLNRCDEIGLLVFEEIPGWQHIGPIDWQDIAVTNVSEMIQRDWNHPSIILWGVRINESQDNDPFYTRTNAQARALDPSRQTGGVRYIQNSHFLEDVYTMNDFIHSGEELVLRDQRTVTGLSHDVPYLVTEYNGHMYPTKKTDSEERQHEHVLRHLKVQNASYKDEHISGAIGWCAFDYNTHCDFGSGDRICHHGVMDIFRLPKFASWVYASQVEPTTKVILKPVTHWARGERSIGGIFPLIVLTNCDSISLQYGNSEALHFTEKAVNLSHLPYPPFIIETHHLSADKMGEWGMRWEDLELCGYIKGKKVAQYKMPKDPLPTQLLCIADDASLESGQKDVTRIVLKVVDQLQNTLPYLDLIVNISISGPAKIQGPTSLVLKGGSTAFWIESTGAKGTINCTIQSPSFDSQTLSIEVVEAL